MFIGCTEVRERNEKLQIFSVFFGCLISLVVITQLSKHVMICLSRTKLYVLSYILVTVLLLLLFETIEIVLFQKQHTEVGGRGLGFKYLLHFLLIV